METSRTRPDVKPPAPPGRRIFAALLRTQSWLSVPVAISDALLVGLVADNDLPTPVRIVVAFPAVVFAAILLWPLRVGPPRRISADEADQRTPTQIYLDGGGDPSNTRTMAVLAEADRSQLDRRSTDHR